MKTLSENSQIIVNDRYALDKDKGESWEEISLRSALGAAQAEPSPSKYTEAFHEMIGNQYFIPAGRILRNSGRNRGSLLNCYVLGLGDSIEEIGQFKKDSLTLWSEGGGVGTTLSPLRPSGDIIVGKGGTSSGAVSFAHSFEGDASTIESGGSRRAAGKLDMIVTHPELENFINAKIKDGTLSHFNISVSTVGNFIEAVERDQDWTFMFNQKKYQTVKARYIWDLIITNMLNHAEPGIINLDNMIKNNSYYCAPVETTNPCGEAPLAVNEACDLGSFVLSNFVKGTRTDWKGLEANTHLANRFLDNVLTTNKYILDKIKIAAQNTRKVGMGYMGLADYLFLKAIRYGSKESFVEAERLTKFLRDVSYESSIKLAVEKGSFPKFDPILYGKASFVRKLPATTRMDIKKYGIRNCTTMAMAPTGTISLIPECSSGIEPIPSKGYIRKDRVSDRTYIHPVAERCIVEGGEFPDWFVDAHDVDPKDHLEMQAVIQKYTDGAVSKTINLPKSATKKELSNLLLEYIHDLKGVTVYRDGSREGQPINPLSEKEIKKIVLKNLNRDTTNTADDMSCVSGKCEL